MYLHFIAFWNLENLFAPEDYNQREPWIASRLKNDLKGWTEQLFDTKIAQLVSIIHKMNQGKGPDILGVCEVENAFVLDRLIIQLNNKLPDRHYTKVHADAKRDHRGIDTAFLYDSAQYSVDPEAIFSHFVIRRTGTRDITQVTFITKHNHELIAFCNHWPSRSGGGAHESRGFRATAGETLAYWHERVLEEKGENIPIIAMGDFNDDPFDESLVLHARATREQGDVERSLTARFFNLTWAYLQQKEKDHRGNPKVIHGTLYFKDNGNVFDQLLVSKALLGKENPLRVITESVRIELYPEMIDHRVGYGPRRFGLPKGNAAENINLTGYSDHFPVSVILEEKTD